MNQQNSGKAQPQEVRRLTVSVIGDLWRGSAQPHIRFGGAWLRKAGFAPNDRYVIRVLGGGRLVIEKASRSASDQPRKAHKSYAGGKR